jgi:hypothetical protein
MDHLRFKSEQTAAAYVADGLDPVVREEFELHMMSCSECVEEVEGWRAIKSCLPREDRNGHPTRDTQGIIATPNAADAQSGREEPAAPASGDGTRDTRTSAVAAIRSDPPAASDPAAPSAMPGAARASAGPAPQRSAPASQPAPSSQAAAFPPRPVVHGAMRWRVAAALAAGVIVGAAGGWYGRSAQGPSITGDTIGFYSLPPLMRGPSDCTSVRTGSHIDLIALRVPAANKEQQLVAVDSEGHDLAPDDYSVRMQADGSWLVRLSAQSVRQQGIRFEARSADGTVEPRGCVLSGSQD